MLFNPQVGQRIYRPTLRYYGTIVAVRRYTVDVQFDGCSEAHTYAHAALEPTITTPEQQAQFEDQQRRLAHADKYL